MNNELTPQEEKTLQQVERTSPWDILVLWASVVFPCGLFIVLGIAHKSPIAVASGCGAFIIAMGWSLYHQLKHHRLLQSALIKLRDAKAANSRKQETKP